MASNIEQATIASENGALTLINAKNSDRNEIEKKKTAFGDIKNAPQLFGSSEKSGVKKDERVKESVDDYDSGCVSLMPVDYFEAQVNKLALSDDEIDLWIKCINASRNASRYDDDIEPPTIYEPELAELPEDESPDEFMVEIPWDMPPPSLDSSDYQSCDESMDKSYYE